MASYATVAEEAEAAKGDAVDAKTAAELAQQAAELAQQAAEAAAEQAEGAIEVDDTLSVEGRAADAEVTGNKITGLKEDISTITENRIIDGWVNNHFISTNGTTYNPDGAVGNESFRYVFVDCSAGDVFTINGAGGGNPRLWAFADAENNILDQSIASATGENLVIVAPPNATRLILNDKNKTSNSYIGALLVSKVSANADNITENAVNIDGLKSRTGNLDGNVNIDPSNFELGNITITALGWEYSNSARRVRTKESYDLELEVGDVVRVKDATKANLYIGYQTTSTDYGATGEWVTEWTCKFGGRYALVIKAIPEVTQTDTSYLLSQIEIIKYNNIAQRTIINASHNPSLLSANHRGMNRNAPENTLPAFQQSKRYGFDYVETDIVWTSDGVPVLLHDASINRTARNADGTEISDTVNIADITYAQALEYDFGIWKASKWAGTKIPTFEQLLIQCKKQGIKILAEVKTYGYTSARLTELLDLVKSVGAEKLVMWISFETSLLNAIKNVNDKADLGLLSASVNSTVLTTAQSLKTDRNTVVLMSSTYTSEAVDLCIDADIPLWAYTINDINTLNALPMYICGVTSDRYAVNVEWANN